MPPLNVLQWVCAVLTMGTLAHADVIYVNDDAGGANTGTSWTDAFGELQSALAVVQAGDEIWVATGTYRPDYDAGTETHTGAREASFELISGVEIYGGFDGTESVLDDRAGLFGATVLSGDLNGNDGPGFTHYEDNSLHVVRANPGTTGATLDGFIITGGNANGVNAFDHTGGGALLDDCNCTVRNCCFEHSRADQYGGGLGYTSAQFILQDCTFKNNTAQYGGGGGSDHSTATPVVVGCRFYDNTAEVGGGWANGENSNTVMVNCLFAGNSAVWGGGVTYADDGSTLTAINCTIVDNTAEVLIGGIEIETGGVYNCIIWGNSDSTGQGELAQAYSHGSVQGTEYCTIQGWSGVYPGVGNSSADPLFVDPDGPDDVPETHEDNDYRLVLASPCIDAGNNAAVPPDTADLDGDDDTAEPTPFDLGLKPRFVDEPNTADTGNGRAPVVDMGAFEAADCTDNGPGGVNELVVHIEIDALGTAVTRDVTFDISDCTTPVDTRVESVSFDPTGLGSITLTNVSPNATWVAVSEGHTLRRLLPVTMVDCAATVEVTGSATLVSGDFYTTAVPKDNFIDISDFAILSAHWLQGVDGCDGDPGTPDGNCSEGADANGDGIQGSADFSALVVNFFQAGQAESGCVSPAGGLRPQLSAAVSDLEVKGAALADVDRNGIVDIHDMRAFAARERLPLTNEALDRLDALERMSSKIPSR